LISMKSARAAPARAGGDPRIELLGGGLTFENTKSPLDLQMLRAAWIVRRCAISPDLAVFLASLALGEAAR
jgi:hypothetical protein